LVENVSAAQFSDDQPVSGRKADLLNRAPFADRIAQVILDLPPGPGLVIGVYAPWGDGKTSVLNFLSERLSDDPTIVVRPFNPWRMTDDEAIFRGFTRVLAEGIGVSLATRTEATLAKLGKFAGLVRPLTKLWGKFSKAGESVDKLIGSLEGVGRGTTLDVEVVRKRIAAHLANASTRVVIIVDDIDRLDRHETHMLFRLIKACGEFPNVSYVLAFDDIAVAKALGERYGSGDEASGRAFLEKIVQVPLRLPAASASDLRELCLGEVDRALVSARIELTKSEVAEFLKGYEGGVAVKLKNARAAKRLGNGLRFALPMLKGEVNTVDLLHLQCLAAFYPEVYEIIRENQSDFSGYEPDRLGAKRGRSRAAERLQRSIDGLEEEEAEALKRLVVDLFPRVGPAYGKPAFGSDWLDGWAREKRVCSPEYVARYFAYAVPRADVSDSAVDLMVHAASEGDSAATEATLDKWVTERTGRGLLEKLRLREGVLSPPAAKALALGLAKRAGSLPRVASIFSVAEPIAQAAIRISNLVERSGTGSERLRVAQEVMQLSEPLWFAAQCLRWLRATDKEDRESQNVLSDAELRAARRTLVDRIVARAAAGELEERAVLGDEDVGARGERGLQEHLVVGVAAARQAGALVRRERDVDAPRQAPRLAERALLRGARDAVPAEIVGEHALELRVAGGVEVDLGAVQVHGVAQPADAGVVEHQPVEPDLRVEDKSEHRAIAYRE